MQKNVFDLIASSYIEPVGRRNKFSFSEDETINFNAIFLKFLCDYGLITDELKDSSFQMFNLWL